MSDPDDVESDFLKPAMQRLAHGATLAEFCAWFANFQAGSLLPGAQARVTEPRDAPAQARRAAIVLAREIWRTTPDPAHGWGPRRLPQPGRNDPCFCGSGSKYKQCCQTLVAGMPAPDMELTPMGGMLFLEGPAEWRAPVALAGMPPAQLAAAAFNWNEAHGPRGVVDLLEPLFLQPARLGERHEQAFDILMDAMLDQGLDARREQVARAVAGRAGHRRLRSTAHARLAVMLGDRGDYQAAWQEVQHAQRQDADNPELLHLEMTLLLSQGREQEARARAPLLSARARKLGYDELSDVLNRMATDGMAAALRGLGIDGLDDDDEMAWVELLRAPLPLLQAARFARLHVLTESGGELAIGVVKALERPIANWRRRFGAQTGALTALDGDADALLDEAAAASEWLRNHPDCGCSVPVLDDLLIAARLMVAESRSPEVERAAQELGFAVAEMLASASQHWQGLPLPWLNTENRPVLRVMSQAIALALQAGADERALEWMRWMLERNPNDNHGWREHFRLGLLRRGEAEAVLALADRYADDFPPSGHDRALALFLLRRPEEAEAVLRRAHAEYPAFLAALLPEALDRPAVDPPGMRAFAGAGAAWDWRTAVRDIWRECGALRWVGELNLSAGQQPVPVKRTVGKAKGAAKGKAAGRRAVVPGDPVPVLRQHYGEQLAWLLGWLAAVAWAPDGPTSSQWVVEALKRSNCTPDAPAAEALIEAVMNQYNLLNDLRARALPDAPVPVPTGAVEPGDDAAWARFASAFVQYAETHASATWRAAGVSPGARRGPWTPLRQLAATAPVGPQDWRPTDDGERPLLDIAGGSAPALDLLQRALQPLWERALAAR